MISLDQGNLGNFAQDSALSIVPVLTAQPAAAGTRVIFAFTWFGALTLTSIDGGGLTWSIDNQQRGGGGSANIGIGSAYAPSGLPAGTTVNGNLSGSSAGGNSGCGLSLNGVLAAAPLDTIDGPVNTATTAWTTNGMTIADGSVIVAASSNFHTFATSLPTAPSVEDQDFGVSPTAFALTVCHRIEAVGGSFTVAGTWSASTVGNGQTTAVAYKAAPASPAGQRALVGAGS